jgi:hypothetical protein
MMLAADRIAANVMVANPSWVTRCIEKYLNVSEEWLRSHGASEAEEAQETLDWVEQIARRLVGMGPANLHVTTSHEEQPA